MKILYLMHIDWNWIKQRPHYIAEYLVKNNVDVDLYYFDSGRKDLINNTTSIMNINAIPRLKGGRFKIIQKINSLIYANFVRKLQKRRNYDFVFITHPCMYTKSIKEKLIYDCMDDNVAFNISSKKRNEILNLEKSILVKSYMNIFSSQYLKDTVLGRNEIKSDNNVVINNAIHLPQYDVVSNKCNCNNNSIVLSYIGTISDWFDFNLIDEVISKFTDKKLIFNLYGPTDIKEQKPSTKVNFMGSVAHSEIYKIMGESDILVMPFIVNDLIKSVNPVKLYEYIYSGKPVISVRYGETEKFKDQVFLYENGDANSFIKVIKEIIDRDFTAKLKKEEALEFIKNNTWESRVKTLISMIS